MKVKRYYDVTTIMQAPKKPVGIARIEFEICRYLLTQRLDCDFCQYDSAAGLFVAVSHEAVAAEVARFGEAGVVVAPVSEPLLGRTLADGLRGLLRLLAPPTLIAELRRLKQSLFRVVCRTVRSSQGLAFASGDCLIWFGISWDPFRLEALRRLHAVSGVVCVYYCHDIIPYLFPHFVSTESRRQFELYMETIAETATGLLFNSVCSREDFCRYLDQTGRAHVPSVVVHPAVNVLYCPAQNAVSEAVQALAGERYVLYVSTIEGRKNHDVLYKAWLYLRAQGFAAPRLVILGSYGWCATDLIYNLRFDERIRASVTVVENASDSELAFLYRHCLFTLYPSFYEGWGMPVSESLSVGKFCLTSGQGALREAGGDFVHVIDPYDVVAWADAILYFADHPEILAAREAKIRDSFVPQTWSDFGRKSFDFIDACTSITCAS